MLMHTDNGGVDHLDSGIVGSGKCVYDAAPDTSPPPADETVIAGRVRAKMIRQIAPRCPGSQDPEDAVAETPRGLFGSIRRRFLGPIRTLSSDPKRTYARSSAERSADARTAVVPAHLPVARNDAMARYRRIVI